MNWCRHFIKYCPMTVVLCLSSALNLPVCFAADDIVLSKNMTLEEIRTSGLTCEECHQKINPSLYQEYMDGEHGRIGVICKDCHGEDHTSMPTASARFACEECHPDKVQQFLAGSHSWAWENMQASHLYSSRMDILKRKGCEGCHIIGGGDNDGRCDLCHTGHGFSKYEAARPQTCATCHAGPDQPKIKAYFQTGDHFTPSTCSNCHLPLEYHDTGENLDLLRDMYYFNECGNCHDENFRNKWLDTAQIARSQGDKMLASARDIVSFLNKTGRLFPDPRGREKRMDEDDMNDGPVPHYIYNDCSRAEKIYFVMQSYFQQYFDIGVFHQNLNLSLDGRLMVLQYFLDELRAESLLLQELAQEKVILSPIKTQVENEDVGDIYLKTYVLSLHGVVPDSGNKPSCNTCHSSYDYGSTQRPNWLLICVNCHTPAMSEKFVHDLNEIKMHSTAINNSAMDIVKTLLTDGIFSIDDYGSLQIAEDYKQNQAVAEALLERFEYFLKNLERSRTAMVLGVAHSSPAYTFWSVEALTKNDMIEIRDAAAKLKRMKKVYIDKNMLPIGPFPQVLQ